MYWIPIAIALSWIILRRRAGLPVVPQLSAHPFAGGGMLVNTQHGAVVVPNDTPILHPADAVDQGVVTPQAMVTAATTIMASASLAPPIQMKRAHHGVGVTSSLLDPTTGSSV